MDHLEEFSLRAQCYEYARDHLQTKHNSEVSNALAYWNRLVESNKHAAESFPSVNSWGGIGTQPRSYSVPEIKNIPEYPSTEQILFIANQLYDSFLRKLDKK